MSSWLKCLGVDESRQHLQESLGLAERRGVSSIANEFHCRVRSDCLCCVPSDRRELVIEFASNQQHRHGELAESVVQRFLLTRTECAESRGKALRGVGEATLHIGLFRREVVEHWLCEPVIKETRKADWVRLGVRSRIEPVREAVISSLSRHSIVGIRDSRRHADEHHSINEMREIEREAKCETSPHRVADVDRVAHLVGNELCRVGKIAHTNVARSPMTGKLGQDDLMIERQDVRDVAPRARSLAKSMDECDRRTGAATFDRQRSGCHAL